MMFPIMTSRLNTIQCPATLSRHTDALSHFLHPWPLWEENLSERPRISAVMQKGSPTLAQSFEKSPLRTTKIATFSPVVMNNGYNDQGVVHNIIGKVATSAAPTS